MKRFSGQQQSNIGDTIQVTNYAFEHSEENHGELLLVPFRMMKPLVPKPASKAAAVGMSEPAAATRGLLNRYGSRTKREGSPPAGRRFIVTSPEAPGVLMIYKDNSLEGKVLSTVLSVSLSDATVEADEHEAWQLRIVTHTKGKIFIRASDELERNDWVACLHKSILSFSQGVTQLATPSEQDVCGDPVEASSTAQPVIAPNASGGGGDTVHGSVTAPPTIQEQDVCGDPVEASSTAQPVIAPYAEMAHEETFDVDDTLGDDLSHEGHMAVSYSSSSFSSFTLTSSTSSSTPATPKEKACPADDLYKQYKKASPTDYLYKQYKKASPSDELYKKASPADDLYMLVPVYTSLSSYKQYKRVAGPPVGAHLHKTARPSQDSTIVRSGLLAHHVVTRCIIWLTPLRDARGISDPISFAPIIPIVRLEQQRRRHPR
eukprot:gene30783-35823_t